MLKNEVKRKKEKRENCRNSGSGKDQKEEMKEIEVDRKKCRAKGEVRRGNENQAIWGLENREVRRPRNKLRYVARV